ncbi:beta-lactamase family protein [Gammaproteobacteria bacterium]|jgi:CubicO group peptidase (beta-lactamase class C family)|nr:beta-lactamase family protein [Gammaproteobacteria bacterium]MDA7782588.1 beta-lactamase family protein [Gammaproteobacteria bacterium]MDA9184599.1 beta-lactamase family protein [Gammaproteobacteria bacterium]MDB4166272.1 beta-lactamase family protein [Gammaproteobacteria bacterium]MDC1422253.1 beta-lactamase family protein [Gammaproteobacteria bacterium]
MRENHFLTLNRALNGAMLAAVLLTYSSVFAAEIASPESVGMSSAALNSATARLQKHIDDGEIAGVVAAVARDGKLVYQVALGKLDRERDADMREDALFRIYSMSREITSVAALRLFEEGAFNFDDPVSKYLPEFSDQRVLLNSESTDLEATRPRVGEMTIAHLLTHTSGLGSRSSALYRENNVRDRAQSLDAMVSKAAQVPLFQDPGTEFRYGIHATIIGKLIEVWSGQPFEEYLQQNLLAPLGMTSTLFWAEGNDADRLAQLYRPEAGELSPYAIETVPWTQRPVLVEGGVGLLSSVPDYVRFSQMILDRGKIPGTEERILSEATAALIYENAVPEAAMPIGDSRYWLGSGWSLGGFNVVLDPSTYAYPVSKGTIWWDGSAGTRFFIDPIEGTVIVIMAQVSPSNGGGFRENFSHLVDAAIIERR